MNGSDGLDHAYWWFYCMPVWSFAANFCFKFVKQSTGAKESIASAQSRSGGFSMLNGWLINQASLDG
jgi:hypothetical protein